MIDQISNHFNKYKQKIQRVAVQLDNSKKWLQVDQYLTRKEKVIIPVPYFFTKGQIQHMVNVSGVDTVICGKNASLLWQSFGFEIIACLENAVLLNRKLVNPPILPKATHKITFTSGTTAEPKGVCLSLKHIEMVSASLAKVTTHFRVKKHMSILPLSVLLENIASHYSAELMGIEVITPSLQELGLMGSSQINIESLVNTIVKYQPDSLILMPQMLKMLVVYIQSHIVDLSFLKFLAVGGAVCSKYLLQKSHQLNLPVYEGYGISECGSVISLNTDKNKRGYVGKILAHQQIKIANDGEILIKGPLYLGYVGEAENKDEWFYTGDLGQLTKEGDLKIIGRKKNTIINSFGRNISPDWIEAELMARPEILQAAIYGEAQPYLTAICVTQTDAENVQIAIDIINQTLPDYAQVKNTIISDRFFTYDNKMATSSGKIKHQQIFNHFKTQLQENYANTTHN